MQSTTSDRVRESPRALGAYRWCVWVSWPRRDWRPAWHLHLVRAVVSKRATNGLLLLLPLPSWRRSGWLHRAGLLELSARLSRLRAAATTGACTHSGSASRHLRSALLPQRFRIARDRRGLRRRAALVSRERIDRGLVLRSPQDCLKMSAELSLKLFQLRTRVRVQASLHARIEHLLPAHAVQRLRVMVDQR